MVLVPIVLGGAAWGQARFRAQEIQKEFGVVYAVLTADMNGDGRPDIIAGGRATANVKIYWNEK